jgi:hypothetical protein
MRLGKEKGGKLEGGIMDEAERRDKEWMTGR